MEINDVLLGCVIACQWMFVGLIALGAIEASHLAGASASVKVAAATATSNAINASSPHCHTSREISICQVATQSIVKVPDVTPAVKSEIKKPSTAELMVFTKVQLHELCHSRGLKRKSAYSKKELVDYLIQSYCQSC